MPTDSSALLTTLVAFDTTSRHSNLALIDWVRQYLAGLGVDCRLTYNDDRTKANLFALLGPAERPALILSGHSDVVPVDGQAWSSPPFVLTARDGRLYGRGAADMKGFIACVLAWLPSVLAVHAAGRLWQPVGFALSYDEEVGCLGVPRLVSDLIARGVPVAGCVIGEPTLMRPVVAHKGIAHFRCRVRGRAAHSSLTPLGVNAIEYAARLIGHIRKLADAEAQFGRARPLYDVPFATLQTGLIHGGSAANIVPSECEFVFECRWLPGEPLSRYIDSVRDYAATLAEEMRRQAPEAGIDIAPLIDCPPFESPEDGALMRYIAELCPDQPRQAVAYTTEAGCFSAAGFPCVVLGPGSIEQAHRPDEYIEAEQLTICDAWLADLREILCRLR
ncbi:MAG: acetylornithine deacetylase [Paludibacterium sp.]|uniref:acetylornithine deacetylase n=1 Tax=Paludibacterium sp. TaxID=1917523 RepID=UPI0025D3F886|nr:acetylornithine deacetylase [Paludibacterium sp.]MBV8048288.1 acetylornithine deacetylase [Paludibacterium sp.]MBV8646465.1 acetylornithine deacetylase [Paludibacterium sp.]